MRKRMLAVILLGCLLFTGCVVNEDELPEETREFAKSNDDDEEIVQSYEDIAAGIDFSESHIYAELKKNLTVDADILNEVPDVLGVYEYLEAEILDEETSRKRDEEIIKLVDDFYGKDVTITFDEAIDSEYDMDASEMTIFIGNSMSFSVEGIDSKYLIGELWENHYTGVKSDYDQEMIEAKIDQFVTHFQSILPQGVGEKYRCLHFDNTFWATTGAVAAGDWSFMDVQDKNYYWIRLYDEVESGIVCNEGSNNLKMEEIGETSWFTTFEPDHNGIIYCGSRNSYVDMYLDENGQLMAFDICRDIDEGECVKVEEIIDAETVLGLVYDLYKDVIVYQQVTIGKIDLYYRVLPASELDENGYRAAHVTPIWVVKFTKKGSDIGDKTIIFDAITGQLLYREV